MKTNNNNDNHPFKIVRRASVPLCAFETADPAATVLSCVKALNGKPPGLLQWDCIRGLSGINPVGQAIAATYGDPMDTQNLPQCLSLMAKTPPATGDGPAATVFIHGADQALNDWTAVQAIWNLRDVFKAIGATLVLIGPSIKLPPALAGDVPLFEEPAPTGDDITRLIDSTVKDAEIPAPTEDERGRIQDSLTGYQSRFSMEQSLALSVTKTGFDIDRLWDLKVASLKSTAGLEISKPKVDLSALAGCCGIKEFMLRVINGRERPRGVFFLDEIEKMVAGGAGDLSGTSQAMIEQFLYWTEARRVLGVLLLGIPGAGKTYTAQCTAGELRVPLLRGSMSTVKGSLVGQSEANMRTLLKTVDSVTSGRTLLIATCNSLENLSPEIIARFKLGVFFYDYPSPEESAALWALYLKQYELNDEAPGRTVCANWVGREIESCCHRAWLFKCSVAEAALSVVPVCRANAVKMETLRRSVSNRFLSAGKPGTYEYSEITSSISNTGRKFNQ